MADSAGNETAIYESTEEGVAAWYELIVVRYEKIFGLISGGTGTTIKVERLAHTYGFGKPDGPLNWNEKNIVAVYTSEWKKWAERTEPGVLLPGTEVDPTSIEQMIALGRAMFCHELGGYLPLIADQIRRGIAIATKSVAPVESATIEFEGRATLIPELSVEETMEEQRNIKVRAQGIRDVIEMGESGMDGSDRLTAEELENWKTTLEVAERKEDSFLGTETLPPPEVEQGRPLTSQADVHWVADPGNNPDCWHLPSTARGVTFNITAKLIRRALELNHFAPPAQLHGKLIIAIRGARFAEANGSVLNATSIPLAEQSPDYGAFRCLIGVLETDGGKLSLFPASTVPNEGGVAHYHNFRNGHRGEFFANMLPTGYYRYCVGTHFGSQTVRGVPRLGTGSGPEQASRATVLRTEHDGTYGTQDDWDDCIPQDNVHPAFGTTSFSSLGCLTVRGHPRAGEWLAFQKAAGFNEDNQGTRFDALLLSGMEFAAIAGATDSEEQTKKLVCLRHGSKGDLVRALQAKPRFPASTHGGSFGPGTKRRMAELQQDKLNGIATGIYNIENGSNARIRDFQLRCRDWTTQKLNN